MKITHVKHSQTDLKCSKCGAEIRASRDKVQSKTNARTGKQSEVNVRVLGDPYRWIKFNRSPRTVRCMNAGCTFRRGDLTTSDKLRRVYDAQDTAYDTIKSWDGASDSACEDLKSALEELASEIRDVASEYEESADNIESSFTGGSATADDCREKSEGLNAWADELESPDLEEFDGDESDEDALKQWIEDQSSKANEAVNECPL